MITLGGGRRLSIVAIAGAALLVGAAGATAVHAAPVAKAKAKPVLRREVITVRRDNTTKQGVVALVGRIHADGLPGFLAIIDREDGYLPGLDALQDFNLSDDLVRYGHGAATPLCSSPIICTYDPRNQTLDFSFTATAQAGSTDYSPKRTLYIAVEGTALDFTSASNGFTVTRHSRASFQRVLADQSDADGVRSLGAGVELFRGAELRGGARGSAAVLQLPCDQAGVGAVTFSATGDFVPNAVDCYPLLSSEFSANGADGTGIAVRESRGSTSWQVSGAVTGATSTLTRLFVLNY